MAKVLKLAIVLGAFEFVKKRYGHIDIVCNSAGVAAYDQELEASVRALRVNLVSRVLHSHRITYKSQ